MKQGSQKRKRKERSERKQDVKKRKMLKGDRKREGLQKRDMDERVMTVINMMRRKKRRITRR